MASKAALAGCSLRRTRCGRSSIWCILSGMKAAREFLQRLSQQFPPPEGVNHALAVNAGKLTVVLFHEGAWESYVIEDDDFGKSVDTLVGEVVALREQRKA